MGGKGVAAAAGTGVAAGGEINAYSGVGEGLSVPASNIHAGGILGSRMWCHILSWEDTTIPVMVSSILKQSLPWL